MKEEFGLELSRLHRMRERRKGEGSRKRKETRNRRRLSVKTKIISWSKFLPTPRIKPGTSISVGCHSTPAPPPMPQIIIDN